VSQNFHEGESLETKLTSKNQPNQTTVKVLFLNIYSIRVHNECWSECTLLKYFNFFVFRRKFVYCSVSLKVYPHKIYPTKIYFLINRNCRRLLPNLKTCTQYIYGKQKSHPECALKCVLA
jgi:hypothetical protein